MANWSLALVFSILLAIQGFSASQTTGVCSRPLSRRTSREQSYITTQYTYYTYYTSCGFLWLGRCRRTGVSSTPRTAYRRVYETEHYSEHYCCSGYSGSPPNCQRVCPPLYSPSNGRVFVSSLYVNSQATYLCNSGYGLSGSSSRTCLSSGSWSGSQPSCQRVCANLPHPSGGYVSVGSHFIGGRAHYYCNSGYRLDGLSQRICTSQWSSPTWSPREPRCIRLCADLSPPKNGMVDVTSYDVGDKATYSCNVGYGMVGSSKRTCLLTGEWSGTKPHCQMTCPPLTSPNKGRIVVNNYFDGGVVTYMCNHGYQIYGNSHQRMCKQGNWTGSDIVCEANVCPKLRNPDRGRVDVTGYAPGSSANYKCDSSEYTLVGEGTRYCTRERVWSASQPTCQKIEPRANSRAENCSSTRYGLIMDGREEVAQLIIESLDDSETDELRSFSLAFSLLTNYSIELSEENFNNFLEALTEISVTLQGACNEYDEIPNDANIPHIIQQFMKEFSTNKDLPTLRSLYGQVLCIQKHDTRRHKRESNECECPSGGIYNITRSCQFFRCIDPDHRETIFGLGTEKYYFPCLAFVVDTTGSMRDEINDAKNIILQFIGAEEDFFQSEGCYLLVPFNDVGPDHANVANKSVGPAAFTFVDNVNDLIMFYDNIISLNAIENSGGDVPEYTLDAIQYALDFEFEVPHIGLVNFREGSQVIVLTDAPTKNVYLNKSIIEKANSLKVCVHFFLSHPDSLKDGVYESIADNTSGTVVYEYSSLKLASFLSLHDEEPCDNLSTERKKRATLPVSKCRHFFVSRLASSVKFAGEADSASNVTLTSPSQNLTEIVPFGKAAIYRISNPEPGKWRACVESGSLEVSVVEDVKIDTTILYNNGQSNGSITPPPECSIGEIVLLTSKATWCGTVNLHLLNRDRRGELVKTIPMSGCAGDQAFIGSTTFPRGAYSYQITGTDTIGIPFQHRIKSSVVRFKTGKYNMTILDTNLRGADKVNCTLYISNENEYYSTFKLSAHVPGLTLGVYPSEVTLPPKDSLSVILAISVLSFSPLANSSQNLTIRADNGCTRLTSSQPITFEQVSYLPTTAPTVSTNECGCVNGGRCQVLVVGRGRVYRRCHCSQGYRGLKCQIQY